MFTPLARNAEVGKGTLDLKPFLQQMNASLRGLPDLKERNEVPDPFEMLEADPVEITPQHVDNSVFIDGIQSAKVLSYENHRPVILSFTSAGGVSQALQPVDLIETLEVICCESKAEELLAGGCPVAVTTVPDSDNPGDVDSAVQRIVGESRDKQEFLLAARLLRADPDGLIIADGHLARRPDDERMLGIVKTTNTNLIGDESGIWALREGWRSPTFRVPANFGGGTVDRYSAYVRLRSSRNRQWSHGLIRVETFTPEMIDTAAAIALANRQGVRTDDPRGDRHVIPVARVEKWLKARIPYYLVGG